MQRPIPRAETRAGLVLRLNTTDSVALLLLGEPGIGKSWCLNELSQKARGTIAFSVKCSMAARNIPLEPVDVLLRSLHDAGRLTSRWLLRERPSSAELLDVRDALAAATQVEPLQIHIDDLQWADDASLEVLEYCVERLQDYPVRWLFAARSGDRRVEALASRLQAQHLLRAEHLRGLAADEVTVIARNANARLDAATARSIIAASQGNPFFVEELARGGGEAPEHVRAGLRARAEALEPDERTVAIVLAVASKSHDMQRIAAVAGLPASRTGAALRRLHDTGFARGNDQGYALRHDLLRDVCLGLASSAEVERFHRALANLTSDTWSRAHHLEEAGDNEAAGEQYMEVALHAIGSSRRDDAERALLAVRRIAPTASARSSAAGVGLKLVRQIFGPAKEGVVPLKRDALNDLFGDLPTGERIRLESAYYRAASWYIRDRSAEAEGLASFLEDAEAEGIRGTAEIYQVLARQYYGSNQLTRCIDAAKRAMERLPDTRTRMQTEVLIGLTRAALGEHVAALESIEQVIGQARSLGLMHEVLSGCCAMIVVLERLERYDEALRWGKYGLSLPGTSATPWHTVLLYNVAESELNAGHAERTLGRLSAAADASQLGSMETAMFAILRAHAQLQTDRIDDSLKTVEAALADYASEWVRLALRLAEARAYDIRGDLPGALERAQFVMRHDSLEVNAVKVRVEAAAAVARLRFKFGMKECDEAIALCDRLRSQHPIGQIAAEVVGAYAALMRERSANNALRLVAALERIPSRFFRAVGTLEAATVLVNRSMFDKAIAEFESIGSRTMAARAHDAARSCEVSLAQRIPRRRYLSERETEIARRVASASTNAEIAAALGISRKTVDNHISNILSKCGLRSRVELAALVIRGELPH
ncbi:MAG: LuxR family transcriptional regulator [Candidatus Eremiobacteraeota bacterium]|nr:LuxR family transcriptional regulator [Candidatus Eremiobacteraeota bacterium]